jgi:hypothetical protein
LIIFELIDNLYKWIRNAKKNIHRYQNLIKEINSNSEQNINRSAERDLYIKNAKSLNVHVNKIKGFLSQIPYELIAESSLRSNSIARALLYYGLDVV